MNTIAIIGSRDWPSQKSQVIVHYVNELPSNSVVVVGGWWVKNRNADMVEPTRGVDRIAADAARKRGLQVVVVPADFDRYNRQAGLRRNPVIIDLGGKVAAFWNGNSRGTAHGIEYAQGKGIPIEIYKP